MARADFLDDRIPCPELIGRLNVLARLRGCVDQLDTVAAHVALVSGEAGVGKSRVVAAAASYAAGRGVQVLSCACLPADRSHPFAPILSLVRARLRMLQPDAATALIAPFARELASLLPEWVSGAEVGSAPSDEARRQQLAALVHCLRPPRLGAQTSTVFVLEDVHWCDDESLDTLLLLMREAGAPLLIIATYRDDEITIGLGQWQAQLARARQSSEIAIPPLDGAEVMAMISAILRAPPELCAACAETIAPLAEGRPFYVEELLKALADAGDLALANGAWSYTAPDDLRLPRSLASVMQQRVALLSKPARALLTLAAVLGRSFDLVLLQRVARVDEPALLAQIGELVTAQLVVVEVPDQFAFRHALTQQAIYAGLLARERRRLHHAAATAIEQMSTGGHEARQAELAHHYAHSGDWARALACAWTAAEQAQQIHASQTAIQLYTLAIAAAEHLRAPAGVPLQIEPTPAQLYLARGQAFDMAGQFDPAAQDYARARELAERTGDRETLWASHSHQGTLWSSRDYAQAGIYWQRALDEARALAQPALVARSLNEVGNWLVNTARPEQAIDRHHEALGIFERLGDRPGTAQTLDRLGMASFLRADVLASLNFYERATVIFAELGDSYGLVSSLVMTMSTRAGTSFFDWVVDRPEAFPRALADGERALELARRLNWRAGESFALWTMGTLLSHYGQYGRALELAHQGCEIAAEIGHVQWEAASLWTLGMIYLDLLAPRRAQEQLERALELGREIRSGVWTHHAACALAVAYLGDHMRERAEALLDETFAAGLPVAWSGQMALLWARAHLALGRRTPAVALRLIEQAGVSGAAAALSRDTTRLILVRAEALIAGGHASEAEATLTRLRDAAARQGAYTPLWRSHVALGALHHRAGRSDDAQREYSAAHSLIAALAAGLPDAELREDFSRAAAERIPSRYSPTSRRARAARYDGLTSREVEVATLVARGLANAEIAGALVIGLRTVETHIGNIFAKLGVAERQSIAEWARQKDLAP